MTEPQEPAGSVPARMGLVPTEDDDSFETYTVVFPHEAQPDYNRISFLSPIGRKLLMSTMMQSHELDIPSGVIKINVEDIQYIPLSSDN